MNKAASELGKMAAAKGGRMRVLIRWVVGDWWYPVTDGETWGIYHPWRWHRWSYGLTKHQAKRECRYRNLGV